MDYDVFISYSRLDTAIADKICEAFDKAGITYFIDRQGIGGAFEFPAVLANAILNSEIFLYLASENSYKSKFTNSEVTFAFNEKPKNRILPYIIDGSRLPVEQRFIFSAINWRDMKSHPIDTVLIPDMLQLLGRQPIAIPKPAPKPKPTPKPKPAPEAPKPKPEVSTRAQTEIDVDAKTANKKGDEFYNVKNYTEAIKWYRIGAEKGYASAQVNLGYMYSMGYGVDKDKSEAVNWYHKAAEQRNKIAQYNLGLYYDNGEGVAQNEAEAVKWYHKAAEQGHVKAQYKLGFRYSRGCMGVDKNEAEAVKWYLKAAEQGDNNAQNALAHLYYDKESGVRNEVEAAKWFLKLADQGNYVAQFNLGVMYENGEGVAHDKIEAVKWFRKAAEQGHAKAKEKVAQAEFENDAPNMSADELYKKAQTVYYSDISYTDKELGLKYYTLAAEKGNKKAIKFLSGERIPKWVVTAALMGGWKSKEVMYEQIFTNDNEEYVKAWAEIKAKNLTPEQMYKKGMSLAQNEFNAWYPLDEKKQEAALYVLAAAVNGYVDAQFEAGQIFKVTPEVIVARSSILSSSIKVPISKALKWYRKAADGGNVKAMIEIGNCYRKGEGVEKDKIKAEGWYRKASNKGSAEGAKLIEKLNKKWWQF